MRIGNIVIALSVVAIATLVVYFVIKPPTGQAAGSLPSFALSSDATRKSYMAAMENQERFSYIACYCGCGMHEMMHRGKVIPKMNSLKECFIKADGSWEDHAAMDCPKCITTALEVSDMIDQGMPLQEIREYVDIKYGDPSHPGLGTPTPVPPDNL